MAIKKIVHVVDEAPEEHHAKTADEVAFEHGVDTNNTPSQSNGETAIVTAGEKILHSQQEHNGALSEKESQPAEQ